MRQTHAHELDLTMIDGVGDFTCPQCGNRISPDDCSERAYSILETRVNGGGLEGLVIRYNRCETHLHLTGFSLLQVLETAGDDPEEEQSVKGWTSRV